MYNKSESDIMYANNVKHKEVEMNSEKEFLKEYNISDYERPSVTADIVVFKMRCEESDSFRKDPERALSLLLIKRGGHPYKDHWALPGGFLSKGESIEECALREVVEETSVKPASLMSVGMFSEPGRDPRGWIISNAFVSVLGQNEETQKSGDDASDAKWFDVFFEQNDDGVYSLELKRDGIELKAKLKEEKSRFGMTSFNIIENGTLAFDHAKIIASALTLLRNSAKDFETIFDFLPEKFTLTQLKNVQETVMNISVLSANFRRKVAGLVEETDEYTEGAGHRPAKLYRRK